MTEDEVTRLRTLLAEATPAARWDYQFWPLLRTDRDLAAAAVQALPALLDLAEAARALVGEWPERQWPEDVRLRAALARLDTEPPQPQAVTTP